MPPELRTMCRILKHNNIAPGEVQALQRIAGLEDARTTHPPTAAPRSAQ